MPHYLLHDLPGASFPAAAPQSPIIPHPEDQGTAMEKFTQDELDHLFAALLLHTKTTREEQTRVGDGTRRNLAEDRRGFRGPRDGADRLPDKPF